MIIYLARHGQTTGDVENRYGGDYDDHLTDLGLYQSSQLSEHLSAEQIEQLFASPLVRAQETASVIAEKLELVATTLPDFKERNSYGILTGMTKEEAKTKHPDQVELLSDVHNTVSGAEEYAPFQGRVTSALEGVSQGSANRIVVVTHGGSIKLIFREILKMGEIDVEDCAYAVIEAGGGDYKLLSTNGIKVLDS